MSDFECLNKIGQSALEAGMLTPEELLKKTRDLNRDIAKLNKSPATSWVVLAGLKKLQLLDLSGAATDDAALQAIAKLKRLERLGLAATQISDKGISALVRLARLERLRVNGTCVTEQGLEKLKTLRWLQPNWRAPQSIAPATTHNIQA